MPDAHPHDRLDDNQLPTKPQRDAVVEKLRERGIAALRKARPEGVSDEFYRKFGLAHDVIFEDELADA